MGARSVAGLRLCRSIPRRKQGNAPRAWGNGAAEGPGVSWPRERRGVGTWARRPVRALPGPRPSAPPHAGRLEPECGAGRLRGPRAAASRIPSRLGPPRPRIPGPGTAILARTVSSSLRPLLMAFCWFAFCFPRMPRERASWRRGTGHKLHPWTPSKSLDPFTQHPDSPPHSESAFLSAAARSLFPSQARLAGVGEICCAPPSVRPGGSNTC